jgi:hypothetical protein
MLLDDHRNNSNTYNIPNKYLLPPHKLNGVVFNKTMLGHDSESLKKIKDASPTLYSAFKVLGMDNNTVIPYIEIKPYDFVNRWSINSLYPEIIAINKKAVNEKARKKVTFVEAPKPLHAMLGENFLSEPILLSFDSYNDKDILTIRRQMDSLFEKDIYQKSVKKKKLCNKTLMHLKYELAINNGIISKLPTIKNIRNNFFFNDKIARSTYIKSKNKHVAMLNTFLRDHAINLTKRSASNELIIKAPSNIKSGIHDNQVRILAKYLDHFLLGTGYKITEPIKSKIVGHYIKSNKFMKLEDFINQINT